MFEKIKVETGGIVNKEFFGSKSNMYSLFGDNNSGHKKATGLNRTVVAAVSHNEYKDVLLNNKCIIHSLNRIQSEDQRIETYKINKISLSCFDDKIYIQNNGYDGLAFGYQS